MLLMVPAGATCRRGRSIGGNMATDRKLGDEEQKRRRGYDHQGQKNSDFNPTDHGEHASTKAASSEKA